MSKKHLKAHDGNENREETPFKGHNLSQDLLSWYFDHKREMPWRQSHDPYRIWLSEIMLQQTQVVTVRAYFNRFIDKYPDVFHLASANEEDVMKLWEGLGYYSRARNLMKCAKQVVENYDGVFPKEAKQLKQLAGIGPYTAGAISSIAFNQRVPAVDGNVMRVFSRVERIDADISQAKSRAVFEETVMAYMPEDARHFNQALMELGALVCTPKKPLCDQCPIKAHCKGLMQGDYLSYPVKLKKVKQKHVYVAMAIIHVGDCYCVMKQTDRNLLRDLWTFPFVESYELEARDSLDQELIASLKENFDIEVSPLRRLTEIKHVYTHLIWHVIPIIFEAEHFPVVDYPLVQLVDRQGLDTLALPTVVKKVLLGLEEEGLIG